jgi:hypothetical protein
MRIGFTGTQRGMTEPQKRTLHALLKAHNGTALHHGDCVGADAEAHDVARAIGLDITIHPPRIDAKRAWKTSADVRKPRDYLARNKDIVRETAMLIATPSEEVEQLRSGTWSTVRFARELGRPVYVIGPDGTLLKAAEEPAPASAPSDLPSSGLPWGSPEWEDATELEALQRALKR